MRKHAKRGGMKKGKAVRFALGGAGGLALGKTKGKKAAAVGGLAGHVMRKRGGKHCKKCSCH
jgi:hypothetical protein